MFIRSPNPRNIVFRDGGKSVLIRGTAGFVGAVYVADSGVSFTEVTPEAAAICQADPEWHVSRCAVVARLPEGMTACPTEIMEHNAAPKKGK